MEIKILNKKISKEELEEIAKLNYGHMIKGVADIRQNMVALGGQLHADAEAQMLEAGSKQIDLWGFNLHINQPLDKRIQYTSMINIRPYHGNHGLEITDASIKTAVKKVVDSWVE